MAGRWILGKKCRKDHVRNEKGEVALWLTDKNIDSSNWVSILMVGADCRLLSQQDLAEMRKEHHVMMKWPEYGALQTRYMQQVSPLLWCINEVIVDPGPLHMVDPYVVLVKKG